MPRNNEKPSPCSVTPSKGRKKDANSWSLMVNGQLNWQMLVVFLLSAGLVVAMLWIVIPKPASLFGFGNIPAIDGNLAPGEWEGALYKTPFWLDLNNTVDPSTGTRNIDTWNYLYVGSDENDYYIGIDLCGDQTNNPDEEWLDLYLANQMPQVESISPFGFHAMRDRGLEFINWNSTSNSSDPRDISYSSTSTSYSIPFVPGVDTYNVRWGNVTGNYTDFWRNDLQSLTVDSYSGNDFDTSPAHENANFVMIDFAFNMTSKFPKGFESNFLSSVNLTDLHFEVFLTSDLGANDPFEDTNATNIYAAVVTDPNPSVISAIDDFSSLISTYDGDWILFNPDQLGYHLFSTDDLALAADNKWHVSLFFWNENGTNTDFTIYIDRISLGVRTKGYDFYSDTSIASANYDIKYAYGSSENLAELHRMYEIRVSKSEFPTNGDGNLYVYIMGYGTAAITGFDLWVYPAFTFFNFGSLLTIGSSFPTFDGTFTPFSGL